MCAWTLQPVLSYLMQDSLVNPYNVSFLLLHNRQSVGDVSKGITGAGTQRHRSRHEQEEGFIQYGAGSYLNIKVDF